MSDGPARTSSYFLIAALLVITSCEKPREHHIRPKAKPSNSPVPDRFYEDKLNVNPHPYQFTMNNDELCDGDVELLVIIRSAPGHHQRRRAIRETWGSGFSPTDFRVVLAFLVGHTDVISQQQQLEDEYLDNNDIIQENFRDSYRNLTIKDVAAFKWTIQFCHNAKYVMIGSDEILVDTQKLITFLKTKQNNEDKKFLLCHLYPCCTRVYRQHPKYNVTQADYESNAFPSYCSGTAYIAKPHLIEQLYHMSVDTPSFMPDDAWIGVMAEKLGAEFHDSYRYFVGIRENPTVLNSLNQENYIESETMIAILDYDFPGREAEMMPPLWRSMLTHHQIARQQKLESEEKLRKATIDNIFYVGGAIVIFLFLLFCRKNRSCKRQLSMLIRWRP